MYLPLQKQKSGSKIVPLFKILVVRQVRVNLSFLAHEKEPGNKTQTF